MLVSNLSERNNKNLKNALSKILNFVEGKSKEYKYYTLEKNEVVVTKLEDLPCEFTLLLGNKDLNSKLNGQFTSELNDFLFYCSETFEYFTGDLLHPVPNAVTFNKEFYNPTVGYYAMKNNKVLWLKKCGDVRVLYIKHILNKLKEGV